MPSPLLSSLTNRITRNSRKKVIDTRELSSELCGEVKICRKPELDTVEYITCLKDKVLATNQVYKNPLVEIKMLIVLYIYHIMSEYSDLIGWTVMLNTQAIAFSLLTILNEYTAM